MRNSNNSLIIGIVNFFVDLSRQNEEINLGIRAEYDYGKSLFMGVSSIGLDYITSLSRNKYNYKSQINKLNLFISRINEINNLNISPELKQLLILDETKSLVNSK